jgi:catechol 2,3-dioxygenase-like lactoylglutathione lyase family enzyme
VDLDHLQLRVRDPDTVATFYERWFGFTRGRDLGGAGWFLHNDSGFLLALMQAEPHQPLPEGVHIGFHLDTQAEVVAIQAAMATAGIAVSDVIDEQPDEDYVTFRCADPDGTEIEVFWEPTPG